MPAGCRASAGTATSRSRPPATRRSRSARGSSGRERPRDRARGQRLPLCRARPRRQPRWSLRRTRRMWSRRDACHGAVGRRWPRSVPRARHSGAPGKGASRHGRRTDCWQAGSAPVRRGEAVAPSAGDRDRARRAARRTRAVRSAGHQLNLDHLPTSDATHPPGPGRTQMTPPRPVGNRRGRETAAGHAPPSAEQCTTMATAALEGNRPAVRRTDAAPQPRRRATGPRSRVSRGRRPMCSASEIGGIHSWRGIPSGGVAPRSHMPNVLPRCAGRPGAAPYRPRTSGPRTSGPRSPISGPTALDVADDGPSQLDTRAPAAGSPPRRTASR